MKKITFFIILVMFIYGARAKQKKGASMISLPAPSLKGLCSVEEALQGRRSVRSYKVKPLSLTEISQLLWAAYGVTEKSTGFRGGMKTAPSAGAAYPLEIYLVAGDVTGLSDGIYRYLPESHGLLKTGDGDVRSTLCRAAHGQDMIRKAPASIIYSAIYARTTDRYGSRGQNRYVCMDLGHSAQNVYLQAYSLGIGTCAVGAFDDKAVMKVIPFTKDEVPLYIMPLGKI